MKFELKVMGGDCDHGGAVKVDEEDGAGAAVKERVVDGRRC